MIRIYCFFPSVDAVPPVAPVKQWPQFPDGAYGPVREKKRKRHDDDEDSDEYLDNQYIEKYERLLRKSKLLDDDDDEPDIESWDHDVEDDFKNNKLELDYNRNGLDSKRTELDNSKLQSDYKGVYLKNRKNEAKSKLGFDYANSGLDNKRYVHTRTVRDFGVIKPEDITIRPKADQYHDIKANNELQSAGGFRRNSYRPENEDNIYRKTQEFLDVVLKKFPSEQKISDLPQHAVQQLAKDLADHKQYAVSDNSINLKEVKPAFSEVESSKNDPHTLRSDTEEKSRKGSGIERSDIAVFDSKRTIEETVDLTKHKEESAADSKGSKGEDSSPVHSHKELKDFEVERKVQAANSGKPLAEENRDTGSFQAKNGESFI